MPVEGGEAVEVFRVAGKRGIERGIACIRWEPDGNALLVYVHSPEDEDHEIWRVPLDGGQPIRTGLPPEWRLITSLDFHPDGSRIAVFSRGGRGEVWAMEGFPWTEDR